MTWFRCTQCGSEADEDPRILPCDDAGAFADGHYCVNCWRDWLWELRRRVGRANVRDRAMGTASVALLALYFKKRGVSRPSMNPAVEVSLLQKGLGEFLSEVDALGGYWSRELSCSCCGVVAKEMDLRALPAWVPSKERYEQVIRCVNCVDTTLVPIRRQLESVRGAAFSERLCEFLDSRGIHVMQDRRGREDFALLHQAIRSAVALLGTGSLRLAIGPMASVEERMASGSYGR